MADPARPAAKRHTTPVKIAATSIAQHLWWGAPKGSYVMTESCRHARSSSRLLGVGRQSLNNAVECWRKLWPFPSKYCSTAMFARSIREDGLTFKDPTCSKDSA